MTPSEQERRDHLSKLWVPAVLAIGIALGVLVSYSVPLGFRSRFGTFPFELPLRLHIVLTILQVILIASLLIVYVRLYAQTNANYALGLVVVLGALFLHSIFSNPFVIGLVGTIPFGPGFFGLLPDLFLDAAYAVFLYLSLE